MSICSFVSDDFFTKAQHIRQLGKGSYGSVDLYQSGNSSYAVKFQNVFNTPSQSGLPTALLIEADSLVRFRGIPEVIELIGICYQPLSLALIMEQMDTDLLQFIKSNPAEVRIPYVEKFLHQMTKAISLFEMLNITHFDIKPANVLIKMTNYNGDPQLDFKVTDFGLAKPSFQNHPPLGELFTLWYRPPEFLADRNRQTLPQYAGDVWSMALTTGELITGNAIVYGQTVSQNIERIRCLSYSQLNYNEFRRANQIGSISGRIEMEPIFRRRLTPQQYNMLDPNIAELLSMMLILNPDQRPTGNDVLHQSFNDHINPQLINQLIPPEYPRQSNEKSINIINTIVEGQTPRLIAIEIYTRFLAQKEPSVYEDIVPILEPGIFGLTSLMTEPSPPRPGVKIGELHDDVHVLAAIQIAYRYMSFPIDTNVLISRYNQYFFVINHYIDVYQVGLAEKDILTTIDFKIYNINLTPVINTIESPIDISCIPWWKFSGDISTWLS